MRSLKLTVAYDGTDFAGWQRQAAARTVQATLEDALVPIEGQRVVVTGAGRTDAGVHALGQVASVSLTASIACGDLKRALNATLPGDVRVVGADEAPLSFNARFDARSKTYRYVISCRDTMAPALRRYAWHLPQTLDLDSMNAAAAVLCGTHDFAAFQAAGSAVKTSIRTVMASHVSRQQSIWIALEAASADQGNDLIVYTITGSGFLRHMVRNIVGTLADVGRDRRPAAGIPALLASRDRAQASATAPAHGLVLCGVAY